MYERKSGYPIQSKTLLLAGALCLLASCNKEPEVKTPAEIEAPKAAISFFAEYNVGEKPTAFAASHANDKSGYYTWEEAKTACPKGYHLPSDAEWAGMIPQHNKITFDKEATHTDVAEKISVAGVEKDYTSDYVNTGKGITYALRFRGQDNERLAAYRYERMGKYESDNLSSSLRVTVRHLGSSFKGKTGDIAREDFWNKNADKDITRTLPVSGYRSFGDTPTTHRVGLNGSYWTASEIPGIEDISRYGRQIFFDKTTINGNAKYGKAIGFAVRCIADK